MCQVNMLQAKTDLSKLVKKLETGEEEVVVIARNGKPIVQMTLINEKQNMKRLGIAEGLFDVPSDFTEWDKELEELFGDKI